MRGLRALFQRILQTRRNDADMDEELRGHIALHTADGVRAGLTEDEARRQALLHLGGLEQARQAYRERSTLPRLEAVLHDVRFALRQMRKSPGFTLTAILTLALGIGANTVIYTLVDSILLRPLPYPQQDRLMRVNATTAPAYPKGWIRALGDNARTFSALAGFGADAESNVTDGGTADRVFGASVTVNALDVLGLAPAQGAFFTPGDANAGQDRDVVLSYGYWRQRFGGSPDALGRTLRIDGIERRIIGVMPAGVHFPYADTQFVIPVSFKHDDPLDAWTQLDLHAFGRLADGVSPAQAQADLRRLHGLLLPLFPWRMPEIWASDMTVIPLLEAQTGAMRPRLLLLFGAVGLILLIACANVANLMLARATARQREIAIRGALGASGRRLLQQLLCESIVLGVTAGIAGLIAAGASLRVFIGLLPADTPRIQDVSLHLNDVLFTLGASILAGLLFGLIPALRMASMNLLGTLRQGGRGMVGSGARFSVAMCLVVLQIGLSVVVITAAGLMLRSLNALSHVDPGFRTDRTVTAEVALDASACHDKGRCASFFETLLTSTQAIAGVDAAALADALPLSGRDDNYVYDAEGHPRDARQGALLATGRAVSPGYFDVLGLHLIRGRLLNQEDGTGASHAVVINEHLAHRLWPGQNPLGKHVIDVNDEPSPAVWNGAKAAEVVGVVRDTREVNLQSAGVDAVYLPITPAREQPVLYVLLQSRLSPRETAAGLRRVVASLDAQAPVTRVRAMEEVVAGSVAAPRALAVLLLGFGALAVCIGAVGIYSLIACIVSWQTQEIGLRIALGAQRWQIVLSIVRQSLWLAGAGCAVGMLGAVASGRLLRSFLFEISPLDPLTYAVVAALVLLVALTAAWIPARRAAAVDPILTLRGQ